MATHAVLRGEAHDRNQKQQGREDHQRHEVGARGL
jgi:hypothetical protein